MTTREYFRSLRADLFRADVHAFVAIERLADGIVRSNNPVWDCDVAPVLCWFTPHARLSLLPKIDIEARYRELLELCEIAAEVINREDFGPGEIAAAYGMKAKGVTLTSERPGVVDVSAERCQLQFHPKAFAFVFAPLADDSPVARMFGPGRWLR